MEYSFCFSFESWFQTPLSGRLAILEEYSPSRILGSRCDSLTISVPCIEFFKLIPLFSWSAFSTVFSDGVVEIFSVEILAFLGRISSSESILQN